MTTEQIQVKSHYRTTHQGKVVFVHDYHAGHEMAHKSRAAHFVERTGFGKNSNGSTYIRATDDQDADHIRRAATILGIPSSEETREANHHGNTGRFTHFDFGSKEDSKAVMQMAASEAYSDEEPIPKGMGAADADFAAIYGDLQLPEISKAEADAEFAMLFGDLELPATTGPFGGSPRPQATPLTRNEVNRIVADCRTRGQAFTVTDDFISVWNAECKQDFAHYLEDLFGDWGTGLSLTFDTSSSTRIRISGNQPGKITCLLRTYFLASRDRHAHHDYLTLHDSVKGTGYAEPFLLKSMDYYKAFGMKYADVCAALTLGGYTWSRYGFIPQDDTMWVGQASCIRSNFNNLNLDAKIQSYQTQEAAARSAGNTSLATAMVRKADEARRAKAVMDDPAQKAEFAALLSNRDRWTQWKVSSHILGQFTMPGTSFDGIFRLDDPRHQERMLAYVAGRHSRRTA